MRPLTLRMQAFGPYADSQSVDFRRSIDFGLFGIYGPTGSGKSSIFTAITFALFGEAARTGYDTSSLRSDHASEEVISQVEFVFEVGAKCYLVRRQPAQERKKKRGEGTTTSQAAAWLFDVTGIPIEEISDTNTGVVLAEKKVKTVTDSVVQILGYGVDQFRQIVLLPQGQFEKFLTSETSDRLAILRDLFDVEIYRKLTEKLAEEAREKLQEFKIARGAIEAQLHSNGYQDVEGARESIDEEKVRLGELKKAEIESNKALKKAEKDFNEAEALDNKFKAVEVTSNAVVELEKAKDEINEKRANLVLGQNALKASDLFNVLEQTSKQHDTRSKAFNAAKNQVSEAETAIELLNQKLLDIQKNQSERKAQENAKGVFEQYHSKLKAAEGHKNDLDQATQAFKVAAAVHVDKKSILEKLDIDKDADIQKLSEASERSGRLGDLAQKSSELKGLRDAAKSYEAKIVSVNKGVKEIAAMEERASVCQDQLAEATTEFKSAEAKLSEAQAVHLAKDLSPGAPCPVCGSTDHPNLADTTLDGSFRDKAFRDAKAIFDTANANFAEAQANLKANKPLQNEMEDGLKKLPPPELTASDYSNELEKIEAEVDGLEQCEKQEDIRIRMSSREKNRKKLAEELTEVEANRSEKEIELKNISALFTDKLKDIPEDLRDAVVVKKKLDATKKWVEDYDKGLNAAQDALAEAKIVFAGATATKNSAKTSLDEAEVSLKQTKADFAKRLGELGLDENTYAEGKALNGQLGALEHDVQEYEAKFHTAKTVMRAAIAAVENIDRPNLEGFETAKSELLNSKNSALKTRIEQEAKIGNMEKLLRDITERLEKIERDTSAFAVLDRLAQDFNGDNPAKMTLETYAIATMFERVLEAANLRFQPMSSGRYSLERSGDGKGRSRRGLGIAVYDTHTGKLRATSTLSGGESFLAALSLALGLSDVVQSISGAIRLDTIFIDEGFGTLDQQTLDQSLQTLLDLTAGNRAVGLISHVEMVQQSIPHGFQIIPGARGSSIIEREV